MDDIIGRDFMREEFRAVGQVLFEEPELVFQFPAGRVAQAFALLRKDVGRNLVRDSRFLWLVRFGRDDGFAGIEATFEFSRFLLSRTERPSMSGDAELLAVAGVSEPLGAAALGVAFFPVVVAGRLVPDEDPDPNLLCWLVHCASLGGDGTRAQT